MMEIERNRTSNSEQRAPREREASLPFKVPDLPKTPPRPVRRPAVPSAEKVKEVFKNNPGLEFTQNVGFQGGPSARRKGYRLAMWSLLASIVDGLILVSLSSLFMMAFSLIVKAPMGTILSAVGSRGPTLTLFVEVFLLFSWVYMITIRGLLGYSIGEWACDLRLGQPQERLSSRYILRVAIRSTLILLTGVVVMPVLSLLLGRDVAGAVSGLKLFSLK